MGITGPACFGFERSWFSKAIRCLPDNPGLFDASQEREAQFTLGLGNRQVRALEYWLRCSGVTQREDGSTKLTPFGELICEFDPRVEEPETWFAIHHHLSADRERASTYWFAFRRMPLSFSRSEMLAALEQEFPGKSERTYRDAVSILLSIIDRTEIGSLCRLARIKDGYVVKEEPSLLKASHLAYSICSWAEESAFRTAHVSQVLSEDGPAKPLSLSEETLLRLLNRIQQRYRKRVLWISRTAGLNSVVFAEGVESLAVLRACYLEHLQGMEPVEALRGALNGRTP